MSHPTNPILKICLENHIHKISKFPHNYSLLAKTTRGLFKSHLPKKWNFEYENIDGDRVKLACQRDFFDFKDEYALHPEEAVKFYIVSKTPFEAEEESQSEEIKRSVVAPVEGSLSAKQRRLAYKLLENLKRDDLSKSKREQYEEALKELKNSVPAAPEEDAEKKKSGTVMKGLSKRKEQSFDIESEVLSTEDDYEEEDEDFDSEDEEAEEMIEQLQEIFPEAKVGNLARFVNRNSHLGLNELVENYIQLSV